jgi:hypothetical protein
MARAEDFQPMLPVGYVVNASRIADRRMILAGYRLADLLTRLTEGEFSSILAEQLGFLPSLDYFIRSIQHRLRDRHADLLRRLQIDHQLKPCRLFHRQIGRLGSLQDLSTKYATRRWLSAWSAP